MIHYSRQLLSTQVPGPLGFKGEQDAVCLWGFPPGGALDWQGNGTSISQVSARGRCYAWHACKHEALCTNKETEAQDHTGLEHIPP